MSYILQHFASGLTPLVGVISLTDFTDPQFWIPAYFDPTYVTVTFPANALNIAVIGPNHTNSMPFGGVFSRFRLFPSAATGRIQFTLGYAAYGNASQVGDNSVFGIGWWTNYGTFQMIGFGSVINIGNNLCKSETTSMADTLLNTTDVTGTLGAGAFPSLLRLTFRYDIGGAMNPRRYIIGQSVGTIICEYFHLGIWNNFAAGGGRIWEVGVNPIRGMQFYIGLAGASINNGQSCRINSFNLLEGILVQG